MPSVESAPSSLSRQTCSYSHWCSGAHCPAFSPTGEPRQYSQARELSAPLLPPQGLLCTESQRTASLTQPAPAAGSEGHCGGLLHGSPFLCAERIAVLKHEHLQTVSISSALNSAASVHRLAQGNGYRCNGRENTQYLSDSAEPDSGRPSSA